VSGDQGWMAPSHLGLSLSSRRISQVPRPLVALAHQPWPTDYSRIDVQPAHYRATNDAQRC
jgi:hypothetical protein